MTKYLVALTLHTPVHIVLRRIPMNKAEIEARGRAMKIAMDIENASDFTPELLANIANAIQEAEKRGREDKDFYNSAFLQGRKSGMLRAAEILVKDETCDTGHGIVGSPNYSFANKKAREISLEAEGEMGESDQ